MEKSGAKYGLLVFLYLLLAVSLASFASADPNLNKWLNPNKNNSFASGILNITANIISGNSVNESLVSFNGTNYSMGRTGNIFYYAWNTSLNPDKNYNITLFFNDSLGFSNQDILFDITVDNTKPNVTAAKAGANERGFANPGFFFNASANITDKNLLNITCTLNGKTVGNFTSDGNTYFCNLTAPLTENDFDIMINAADMAGNINGTTIMFTTKYTTSAKLLPFDMTVSELNQSDKMIHVNVTLNNTGNNPIYDAGIILNSFSSSKISPSSVSYQSCSPDSNSTNSMNSINSTKSCNVIFNITISGGLTGTHKAFWNANWTDNNFTRRQFNSVTASTIAIANNPQITAANNISATIMHGQNSTLAININSTGNFKLDNIGAVFAAGSLKSAWINATNVKFSSLSAGANESILMNSLWRIVMLTSVPCTGIHLLA